MKRRSKRMLPAPTPAQLHILRVLWREQPLSAREIHDRVAAERGWSYSTTRTHVDRMTDRGLLKRHAVHGIHVFRAHTSKVVALAGKVREFVDGIVEVDARDVVSLFGESDALSEKEKDDLVHMIESWKGEEG